MRVLSDLDGANAVRDATTRAWDVAEPQPGARRAFVREFVGRPFSVGAVAPSSRVLARRMVEGVDLGAAHAVVEFGPGSGSFTAAILPRLGARTRFFAIEINPRMARLWRRRFPDESLHVDSVERVAELCEREGVEVGGVDAIISGLPWASFPDALQVATLEAVRRVLRPGGRLITFGYHIGTVLPRGRRFYRRLPAYFSRVERGRSVWANLPPAFVVTCTK